MGRASTKDNPLVEVGLLALTSRVARLSGLIGLIRAHIQSKSEVGKL